MATTAVDKPDEVGPGPVPFAFTELLNFGLLPRLKNIGSIRLYRPDDTPPGWPALGASLTRPIRWELIEQQYDQMVKCATVLRFGTAEAEQVLRRFTRGGVPQASHLPGTRRTRPGRAHSTFRLDMDKRLDLGSAIAVPRPRTPTHQAA
ncbi:Tn3 family transposase [Streptomyces spinoverrucosus]|uniref:Tn3 family transposase n=1 Tax=Streptomyces spinoverrucosus TaxID=284043 RepID=UPI0018C38DED